MQANSITKGDVAVMSEVIKHNGLGGWDSMLLELIIIEFDINGYELINGFYLPYSCLDKIYNRKIRDLVKEAKTYRDNKRYAQRTLVKKFKQVLCEKVKEENS